MKKTLMRLMAFVDGYHKAFNEQSFALNVGDEFKSIGKKAFEKAKPLWESLTDGDKKEVADKFPDFFYALMSKKMDIQKTMFYVE